MTVKLAPETVQTEAYGFLLGRVLTVGDFPVTWQNIVNDIGNEQLAHMVTSVEAPIELRISLLEDSATPSGWQWTTSSGPNFALNSGILGVATITVDWQRPIQLLFAGN
jgi:HlyD family secretion protein